MKKTHLESLILEVLAQKRIRNQISLAKALAERGVRTDQSTLSRNLKKLGIEKRDGFYFLTEKKGEGLPITAVPPNLIIVKTLPGHAQALAFKLDSHPLEGLAGTIAGDDTILCIVANPKYMKALCYRLASVRVP